MYIYLSGGYPEAAISCVGQMDRRSNGAGIEGIQPDGSRTQYINVESDSWHNKMAREEKKNSPIHCPLEKAEQTVAAEQKG